MKKIIRCSKLNLSLDSKEITKSSILLLLTMILFLKEVDTIVVYSIVTLVMLIFINDIFSLSKKVDIESDVSMLLEDYNESEYRSDRKYEYKYIKLNGIVSCIEFDEKENILKINLKGNDLYTFKATAYDVTKKCVKYLENIYIGQEIILYGYFKREGSQLLLDIRYLKE